MCVYAPQKKILSSAFFLLAKLPQKEKIEFTIFKKKWFWRLSVLKSEEKISKNHQIFVFGFQYVDKNKKEQLNNPRGGDR